MSDAPVWAPELAIPKGGQGTGVQGRGEGSPARERVLEQGQLPGTGQGPEFTLAALRGGGSLYPVPHCTPGWIWGGPSSEDGMLAAPSPRPRPAPT